MRILNQNINKLLILFIIAIVINMANGFADQQSAEHNIIMKKGTLVFQIRDSKTGYGIPAQFNIVNNSTDEAKIYSTDKNGKLELTFNIGHYSYRVEAKDYSPLSSYFYIYDDKTINIYVWLQETPYKRELDNIISEESAHSSVVYGFVLDKDTYQPLRDVRVTLQNKHLTSVTGQNGFYTIETPVQLAPVDIDSLIFEKYGYSTLIIRKSKIGTGRTRLLAELSPGKGIIIQDDTHKLNKHEDTFQLDMSAAMVIPYGDALVKSIAQLESLSEGNSYLKPPANKQLLEVWDPPDSIRVGTTCSCATCTTVDTMSLETYVERGLNDEWYGTWQPHSLRSGAIAYRSYGSYYVYHPIDINYDICSTTCCQVYNSDTHSAAVAAADYTTGIQLQRSSAIFRSEYSAQNNNYNCSVSNCSNSDCSCGNSYAGSPSASWPCLSDSVCTGTDCFGHGRGMCQWGTQYWALDQSQLWNWIVNHYYNDNGNPSGMRSAFMTSPLDISSASPNPSNVPPGGTFNINAVSVNYAELLHNQIILGARLYSASTGYIDDHNNDIKVTLNPGNNNISRSFNVPLSAPEGLYDLIIELWFDVDENDQINSEDLALISNSYPGAVTVTGSTSCTAPIFSGVQSVADVSTCAYSGIQVTWQQPSDWGQGATSGTYAVRRYADSACNGTYTTVASGLSATITSFTDTSASPGTTYYYQISATNNCATPMSSTGTNSCSNAIADNGNSNPCPSIGNTLMVDKSGNNAQISWNAVSCVNLDHYEVYGSASYSMPFPGDWNLIGSPTITSFSDSLSSNYIAYKTIAVDACDNNSCVQDTWARAFDAVSTEDRALSIQQTDDGGYIAAGQARIGSQGDLEVLVLKLRPNGTIEWKKTYGGNGDDIAFSIQKTNSGGYIIAGETRSFNVIGADIWVLNSDASGNILWQKTYGGDGDDKGYSMAKTNDGGYIIGGTTTSFGSNKDYWVLKLDSNGNIQWQKYYDRGSYDEIYSIQQTNDGGYVFTGIDEMYCCSGQLIIYKLYSNGEVEWTREYGGTYADYGVAIQQISDSGYIVTGHTYSYSPGVDYWVLRLNSSGDIIWQKAYVLNDSNSRDIKQTFDGGFIVAGEAVLGPIRNCWALKLSSSGDIIWQKRYGGSGVEHCSAIQETFDHGFILAGDTSSFGSGNMDVFILKLDQNGIIDVPCSLIQDTTISPTDTDSNALSFSASSNNSSISPVSSTAIAIEPIVTRYLLCPNCSNPIWRPIFQSDVSKEK